MKKELYIVFALSLISAVILVVAGNLSNLRTALGAGSSALNTTPAFLTASSTTYTLTTVSQRLLSTSTPTRRAAATISVFNCTKTNQEVFLNLASDTPATANQGLTANASTTLALADYPWSPIIVQGAVQGITAEGTCTVTVNEWRSQY